MADWPAWVNGQLVPTAEAAVSVHDRGLRGEGVFTTILVRRGTAVDLPAHLDRVAAGLTTLRLDVPPRNTLAEAVHGLVHELAPSAGVDPSASDRWRPDDHAAASGASPVDIAVRLLVTPGPTSPSAPFPAPPHPNAVPTVVATANPVGPADESVTAVTSRLQRPLPSVKSLSYGTESLATRLAREDGADTALLLDGTGHLLEGATTAVAAVVGGVLVSPPDDGRILHSTSLLRLLRAADAAGLPVARRALHRAELAVAEGTLLVSSVSGPRLVEAVDGVALEAGHARRLRTTYLALLDEDVAAA